MNFGTIDEYENRSVGEHNHKTYTRALQATKELGDARNSGSSDAIRAGILSGILSTHRYLSGDVIVQMLHALGDIGGMPEAAVSDGRNAFAYKLCKLLRERFSAELYWKDERS